MTIIDIQNQTRALSEARNLLSDTVMELHTQIEKIKNTFLPTIKRRVARVAEEQAELHRAIQSAPDLFEKPRTQTFHGIEVGLRKGSGKLEWDDNEQTSVLIKKHFPDLFDALVKTSHTPQKKALANLLDVAGLKKVACRVEASGDVIVIRPVDSAVDKLVTALLKNATDDAQKEAA